MEFIKPSEQFDLKGFYLEITSKCNLRCLHCYNESGILKNEISFELFKRLIDEFDEKPDITFSGGEPLLHPDIWKMLEYAQDKINNDSVLITNATLITDEIASSHIKFSGKWTKTNIFWSSIMFLIEAMLLLFLVEQTRIGNIDVGQVILILQSNVLFVSSVSNMIDLASKLKQNDMYVEAFNEVSEYQKLEHRICKEASKDLLVNLKNIVFKYNDRIALNGIDFFMRKGEKIVILGENGSGKSTLVKIILGLLKEDSGIIMVNAEQKSAVFQDFSKFRFTVRENIGIGQQNYMIDDLKISTAIEDVGLHKLKKRLVRGYDTELGKEFFKDGLELSGGEWQKTAIARGIFKDTDLIIFDEPTAAIDPLSEKKQFEDLMDLCEEKGVIIVSHRVGVVHLADRVVFMKSGKIVCEGKHNDLMQKNQSYREFYKSQAKWYV